MMDHQWRLLGLWAPPVPVLTVCGCKAKAPFARLVFSGRKLGRSRADQESGGAGQAHGREIGGTGWAA